MRVEQQNVIKQLFCTRECCSLRITMFILSLILHSFCLISFPLRQCWWARISNCVREAWGVSVGCGCLYQWHGMASYLVNWLPSFFDTLHHHITFQLPFLSGFYRSNYDDGTNASNFLNVAIAKTNRSQHHLTQWKAQKRVEPKNFSFCH